jgi:uncharacterized protein YkwD
VRGRSSGASGSRIAAFVVIPLALLAVIGLILSRSVFASSSAKAALSAQDLTAGSSGATVPTPAGSGPTPGPTDSVGPSESPTAQSIPAPTQITSLGAAKGILTLKGPSVAQAGDFAVFVVDGPKRIVRTDSNAPFAVKINTEKLPNGRYTVSVMTVARGRSSVTSTSTVAIRNGPSASKQAATTTSDSTSGSASDSSDAADSAETATVAGNGSIASQILKLTNAERAKVGCKALAANSDLTQAAQQHSTDMANNDYFDHNSQSGLSPFDRITDAGYKFSAAAENIAMGQQSAVDVMKAWMNSAGHKANILNCTYTDLGVGQAVADGSPYWTQDFGTPL